MTNLPDYARRIANCFNGNFHFAHKDVTAILQELVDAVRAEPVRNITAISGDGARLATLERFNPLESFEVTTE